MLLALFGLLAQTEKPTGFYLKEVVKIDYPGSEAIVLENHTWVGKNRVRTDRLDLNTTIIYDLDIHIVYVIDHNTKTYQISRAPVPKDESRLSLIGLAPSRKVRWNGDRRSLKKREIARKLDHLCVRNIVCSIPLNTGWKRQSGLPTTI